jgi:hypothetical protein
MYIFDLMMKICVDTLILTLYYVHRNEGGRKRSGRIYTKDLVGTGTNLHAPDSFAR